MSPSYNLLHLSPHCHWVYFSILLLYFLVPPASALSSLLISTAAVTWAAWSPFPSGFSLCLLVPHPHQLRGPGVPRPNPPSSRILGGIRNLSLEKDPSPECPPVQHVQPGARLAFSALWTALPEAVTLNNRGGQWPGLPPTEAFTRPPCLIS